MSCYIKSNINTRIGLALNDSGLSSAQYFNIIPTWTKIYATFENNNINTVPRIYLAENKAVEIYVANIKFEKGNRPTDWSPAPEDVDSAISDVDTKVESTKTQLAEIQTNVNGITSRVGTVESKTTTLEKLAEKKLINNFSNSNTLDLWSAPGTTLKYSSIVGYYMDCLSNNQNHMIQSEYFEIDSSKSYKISLMQQFAPNSGTATFYFGIYAYDKDKNNIGVYVDKGTSLNTNPYFMNKRTPTNDYGNWRTWSGYIYSHDTIIQDYTPKGNVTSCMKFSPKTKYLRTRFLHYRTGSYGDSGQGSMYFAQPAIYEIDNQIVNTEQRLKTAEQKITAESIINTIKSSQTNGKNTFVQQSDIIQLNDSWTAKFTDGYSQGITKINKDGITVTSSNVKSKTSMTASGFKITKTDTNEDVFKVNSDGTLNMTGSITTKTSGARSILTGDGINFYNGNTHAGKVSYDTLGAGTVEEARERLWLRSLGGYALKIQSSGDMSPRS